MQEERQVTMDNLRCLQTNLSCFHGTIKMHFECKALAHNMLLVVFYSNIVYDKENFKHIFEKLIIVSWFNF